MLETKLNEARARLTEYLQQNPPSPEEIQAAMELDIMVLAMKLNVNHQLGVNDCKYFIAACTILQQARNLKL